AMLAIWFIPEGGKLGFTLEAEPADRSTADSSPFGDWRLIVGLLALIVVVRALQTSGLGIIMTFSNVYFDEALLVPTSRIGLITGFGRLLGVPMSLTIPWLVRRFGNFNLVIISLGLIAVLIIPIAFIPYWPIAALALMTITSMGSLRYLSFISFTMSLVSEKQRSLVSGAGEMALGIGFSISSFIGGYLIAWYGYSAVFVFGATVTVIGTVIFWVIFRKRVTTIPATPAPAS
ncbi:MAG: putative MFS family arabinose efflux permease, partial [Candidatus Promineifilaceae bacterium]